MSSMLGLDLTKLAWINSPSRRTEVFLVFSASFTKVAERANDLGAMALTKPCLPPRKGGIADDEIVATGTKTKLLDRW